MGELESALASVEGETDSALRGAKAIERELKKAKAAASSGAVRDLERSLEGAEQLASQLASATRSLRASWGIDVQTYVSSGRYSKELVALAHEADVQILEQDNRLLCYPSVVRVVPADLSVQIDRTKFRSIRPSHIISLLRRNQTQQPRFKPEAFLEALVQAYDLVISKEQNRRGATAKLAEVYDVLTLLPGQEKDYTRQEFTRDIYLLDQSGAVRTKDGRELRLPASTLTKNKDVLTTVTVGGQQKVYAGIAFS